jgi:hypothetical protein
VEVLAAAIRSVASPVDIRLVAPRVATHPVVSLAVIRLAVVFTAVVEAAGKSQAKLS